MHLAALLNLLRRRYRPEAVIDRAYPAWRRERTKIEADLWPARIAALKNTPTISVVMPVHNPPDHYLRAAISSVETQLYQRWELCIVDDGSTAPHVAATLAEATARDHRIDVQSLPRQTGIALASNAGIAAAGGRYVGFLDHDDLLAPHALGAIAAEIGAHPDVGVIFSDEDRIVDGAPASPYFKPGWNPDLMLGQNLVCHFAVFSRAVLSDIEGFRPFYEGAQDYDLALRATDRLPPRRIRHIPDILYHWRAAPGSFSATSAAVCRESARRALANHVGGRAVVAADAALPQWQHVQFGLPETLPTVSLILPKGAKAPATAWPNLEILHDGPRHATGEFLVFLAANLATADELWLHELVSHAQRPEIGAVGGALFTRHGALAHSGYVLDQTHIIRSVTPWSDPADPGYRGQFRLIRTVSAVSGDCLCVRHDAFRQAGGLTPDAGAYAAVDLCLRLAARQLRCVWTPHVRLTQTRSSRQSRQGAAWMRARWGDALTNDPYFNPNLTMHRNTLRLRAPGKII
jgi:GT2 family glycosyltransferase